MELTTAHSLWLAPLCALLGVLLAWWLYRRSTEKHGWTRGRALLMAVARALAVAFIAFLLLEPMVRAWNTEVRKPVVVIAHDGSTSLALAGDTAAVRTTYKEAIAELEQELGDRFTVRSFTYGAGVKDGLDFSQRDGLTDMDEVLRAVYDRFGGSDLGAVILDGDGIYNRGRDPRWSAVRLGVPVHTVALGDTTVRPDVALKGADHNRIAFLGNEVPVVARIDARHLRGGTTRVSVMQGDKEFAGKDIGITADPFFTEVPLLVKPEKPGLQAFTVSVRKVDGEVTTANNAITIHIDVIDDRQKVLIVAAAPHPDVAAIRQAMDRLEGYETKLVYASDLPPDVAGNDLLILHQLPARQHPIQTLLQRASAVGIPTLFVLGGASDLGAYSALGVGVDVSGGQRSTSDVTATVQKDFTLFTLDAEDARAFERFPPLQVPFASYEAGVNARVLFTQKVGMVRTPYPLIAFQQNAEHWMATVCGEGLWRWRLADHQMNGGTERFDRLIHRMAQFLALKADKSRFRISHAPEFAEGEKVILNAELYNAALEPVNDVEAVITLTDEEGRDYPYVFIASGNGYRLDAGVLPPGQYSYTARTEREGVKNTTTGRLLVKELVAERLSTVADHGLLADIAAKTGGRMFRADNVASISDELLKNEQLVSRSYRQAVFNDLVSLRWLFFVLLALLTLEWSMRRYSGAY